MLLSFYCLQMVSILHHNMLLCRFVVRIWSNPLQKAGIKQGLAAGIWGCGSGFPGHRGPSTGGYLGFCCFAAPVHSWCETFCVWESCVRACINHSLQSLSWLKLALTLIKRANWGGGFLMLLVLFSPSSIFVFLGARGRPCLVWRHQQWWLVSLHSSHFNPWLFHCR